MTLLSPPLRADGLSFDQPTGLWRPWFRRRWFVALTFVVTMALGWAGSATVVQSLGRSSAVAQLIGQLVGSIAGYLVVLILERRGWLELSGRRWLGLPVGLVAGAGLISACVAIITACGLREFTGVNPAPSIAMALLQAGLVAGVSEELIFRGIFYRMLEARLGTWWTVAASALLFGFAHLPNPNASLWSAIAIALEAGVLFGLLYALTRSLWVLIGLHAAWNIVQGSVFGVSVSGTDAHGLLLSHPVGPALLSGGSFGVEASLITVLLLSGVSVWLARELIRRGLVVRSARARRR